MYELKKEEGLHLFKLGPEHEQPWFCKYRFNPCVDFCIWVLEVDGLRVSPFDQHTARDGTLQTAGLDADGWLSWVKEVVTLQYQLAQASRQPFVQLATEWGRSMHVQGKMPLNPQSETVEQQGEALLENFRASVLASLPSPPQSLIATALNPPAAWKENAAVGQLLGELWEQYRPLSNKRREWERPTERMRQWSSQGDGTVTRLWDDLQPYHTRLEALTLHFVEYPQEVDYLVPPVSVIMAVANGQLDGDTFRTRALRAAEVLATKHPS